MCWPCGLPRYERLEVLQAQHTAGGRFPSANTLGDGKQVAIRFAKQWEVGTVKDEDGHKRSRTTSNGRAAGTKLVVNVASERRRASL